MTAIKSFENAKEKQSCSRKLSHDLNVKQNILLEITQLWPPYKEGRREGRTGDVKKGRNVKQNKKWHNLEITDGIFDLDRMNCPISSDPRVASLDQQKRKHNPN